MADKTSSDCLYAAEQGNYGSNAVVKQADEERNDDSAVMQKPKSSYRADIDGLRTVAVFAVLLYHANEKWVPAGFAGVDIFFVISGFVVATSLQGHKGDATSGEIFLNFYIRRVKRLLPTAALVCAAASIMLYFMFPSYDPRGNRYLKFSIAGILGNANHWAIAEGDDYLDLGDAGLKKKNPWNHMWSLNVEEQFYFVLPLLLVPCMGPQLIHSSSWSKSARNFCLVLMLVTVMSIGTAAAFEKYARSSLSFYTLPARFWEMAVGVLLAAYSSELEVIVERSAPFVKVLVLDVATIAILILSIMIPIRPDIWPVPGAFLPIFAGSLCIISGWYREGVTTSFLSTAPMVYLGKMSYAIYLWHQPILALTFYRYRTEVPPTWLLLLCLVFSVAISYVSHHLVENPCRFYKGSHTVAITWAAVGVGAVIALDALLIGLRSGSIKLPMR
jgi:peptidoglycan/LPS O-acetylase OafA/YrhL